MHRCFVLVFTASLFACSDASSAAPAPAACEFGDDVECPRRCAAGSLESCYFDARRWSAVTKEDQARQQQRLVELCGKGHGGSCNAVAHGLLGPIDDRGDSDEEFGAARPFFEKGCAAGSAKACNNLGSFLRRESLGQRELSLTFFEKSCALADVASLTGCLEAGNQLRDGGFGSSADPVRAGQFYAQACKLGHSGSCAEAGRLGLPTTLTAVEDVALAARFCRRGDLAACHDWGRALWDGKGTAVDKKEADRVLSLVCDGDVNVAGGCGDLGNLRLGVDWQRAGPPLERACAKKHAKSCRRLGDLVLTGQGATQDRARAVELYQQACTLKPPEGCEAAGALSDPSVPFDAVAFFSAGCRGGSGDACSGLRRLGVDPAAVKAGGEAERAVDDARACQKESDGYSCHQAALRLEKAGDRKGARPLYEFGCTAGQTKSCRALMTYYEKAWGGPENLDGSIAAATRACALGDDMVCKLAKARLLKAEKDRKSPALLAARKELEQSCKAGVSGACF
jgi:TPR repeat protein